MTFEKALEEEEVRITNPYMDVEGYRNAESMINDKDGTLEIRPADSSTPDNGFAQYFVQLHRDIEGFACMPAIDPGAKVQLTQTV